MSQRLHPIHRTVVFGPSCEKMRPTQVTSRGSALLCALFIMTLVTIAAIAISSRLQLDNYRTRLMITSDKLYLASQAVAYWAFDYLSDKNHFINNASSQGEIADFPTTLTTYYPQMKVTGALYDLQSRFNINNLQNRLFQPIFIHLLKSMVDNKIKTYLVTKTIQEWISPYHPDQGINITTRYYLKQKPSYFQGYQPLQDISELRLIKGVDSSLYQELHPLVSSLPEITPININTAPIEILKTLGHGLNEAQVLKLINIRGDTGITNLDHLKSLLDELHIEKQSVTLTSQYFMAIATVSHSDLNLSYYFIIKRSIDNHGKVSVKILNQSINTF